MLIFYFYKYSNFKIQNDVSSHQIAEEAVATVC